MQQNQKKLKRAVSQSLITIAICLVLTIPFDAGKYTATFKDYGLIGFLELPLLLVFQIGFFAASIWLFILLLKRNASKNIGLWIYIFGIAGIIY